MFAFWDKWSRIPGSTLGDKQFGDTKMIWGFCGWLLCGLINIVSVEKFKKRFPRAFFYLHLLFILFFVSGILHSLKFIPYAVAGLVFYGTDRLLRLLWNSVPVQATTVTAHGDVLSVRFPKHWLLKCLPNLKLYRTGQWVQMNFPQMSLLEWHPYYLASGPHENTVQIYLRKTMATLKLFYDCQPENLKVHQRMWMRVDGPYGTLQLHHKRFPLNILLAVGNGIIPMLGILKDIYGLGDITKPKADAAPNPRAQIRTEQHCIEAVFVVWIIPDESMYNWFVHEFEAIWSVLSEPNRPPFNLWCYCTKMHSDSIKNKKLCVAGRPDFQQVYDGIMTAYPFRAASVFACGPANMINEAWDVAMARNRAGKGYIHFTHEALQF
jgi:ferredoxin-NADP reductase